MEVPAGSGIAGDTFVDNAGRSTLYGLEAEFAVSEGFLLSGGLGLLATEFDEFDQGGEDLSGNEFSFAPGVTATVGARYRHASGLFGTVQLAYADGYYSDPQNFAADEVDDRFLFDGRLGYERAGLSLSVVGRNLLDDDYLVASATTLTVPGSQGTVAPGPERFFGFELTARF